MTIAKSVVYDGSMQRQLQQGDVLAAAEVVPATIATTNITVTGQILAQPIVLRSNGGASVDTIDSAANIIAALVAGLGNGGLQQNTSWRVKYISSLAFTCTLTATANTGITVTNGVVNGSSVKDFLVTVTNPTPVQTIAGMTVNASAVVSGFTQAQLAALTPGMIVTNAVNGLQGTTILAINSAAGAVTMSGNANATSATPVAITFSPTVAIYGLGQGLL